MKSDIDINGINSFHLDVLGNRNIGAGNGLGPCKVTYKRIEMKVPQIKAMKFGCK